MERHRRIAVIQGGLRHEREDLPPVIAHETTAMTGLRHLKGTVSLARFAPGAVYHSFFICLRDEPVLDFSGARHPDGQGFAAFGRVVAGVRRGAAHFRAGGSGRVSDERDRDPARHHYSDLG